MSSWLLLLGLSWPASAQYPQATAQRPIQWQTDVAKAMRLAQQRNVPLLFFVPGSGRNEDSDLEDAVQRTFRDAIVVQLVEQRFVPVRLVRSSDTRALFAQLGLRPDFGLQVVFATPAGQPMEPPTGAATAPETFRQKLVLIFRKHRADVFNRDLKPVLDDPNADEKRLLAALKMIEDFTLLEADQAVIALARRAGLSDKVRGRVWEVLAALSTRPAVEALLEAATQDPKAAAALEKITPGAAEYLLDAIGGEDAQRHLIAYRAAARAAGIRDVKPPRFWEGRNERIKTQEIERVRHLVRRAAKAWNEQYAEYR